MTKKIPTDRSLDHIKGQDPQPEALVFIARIILTWSRIDAKLTEWLLFEGPLPDGAGHIIIGRMDSRTKLDKLAAFARWRKDKAAVQHLKVISKHFGVWRDFRNMLAHSPLVGVDNDDALYFGDSGGVFVSDEGELLAPVITVDLEKIREAFVESAKIEHLLSKGVWPEPRRETSDVPLTD